MNLFQVKFNLERTSSCKWKVVKQYGNKVGKPSLKQYYDKRRALSRVIVEKQGKVSSEPSRYESMQKKPGLITLNSTLTEDLVFREVRLLRETLG